MIDKSNEIAKKGDNFESGDCGVKCFYKLSEGETPLILSSRYKIPPIAIVTANEGIEFFKGVTIAIPNTAERIYKVEPKDTLEGMCEKFGIDKEQFKKLNGGEFIYPGKVVVV